MYISPAATVPSLFSSSQHLLPRLPRNPSLTIPDALPPLSSARHVRQFILYPPPPIAYRNESIPGLRAVSVSENRRENFPYTGNTPYRKRPPNRELFIDLLIY